MKFWEKFLRDYAEQGAIFHGEGDPPDLILEVKPSPESQSWLWVYRPEGTASDDETKNAMCREILAELKKVIP